MASAHPVTTIADNTMTLVQRFYVKKQNLAMDLLSIKGSQITKQTNFNPDTGNVKYPSSLAGVRRYGLSLVYGVLNIYTGDQNQPVFKSVLAQLAPTVSPITFETNNIALGDNLSVAATSDDKDSGWLYIIKKTGDKPKIIEYTFDYTSGGEPIEETGTMTDVHPRTRLGVAAFSSSENQVQRVVVYQTNDKSLKWRLWPGSEDNTITTDNVLEQTPIAVVVSYVDSVPTIFVYFISDSNRRLMRALKPVNGGNWNTKEVNKTKSKKVSVSTDLAATGVNDGNFLSFIFDGNENYEKLIDPFIE